MFPCPGCNQPVNPRAKFCPNCGFALKSPAAGGKLLTGLPWVDGLLGFILYFMVPLISVPLSSIDPSLSGVIGLLLWVGTPILLGVGLRYRAMALGYLIGFGVTVLLVLGLLVVCGIMMASSVR
jgi:hypothetical protein